MTPETGKLSSSGDGDTGWLASLEISHEGGVRARARLRFDSLLVLYYLYMSLPGTCTVPASVFLRAPHTQRMALAAVTRLSIGSDTTVVAVTRLSIEPGRVFERL